MPRKAPDKIFRTRKETIPTWMKLKVIKRDGPVCRGCGKVGDWVDSETGRILEERAKKYPAGAKEFISFEFDHVIPEISGGETIPENLQILCRSCNRAKGPR